MRIVESGKLGATTEESQSQEIQKHEVDLRTPRSLQSVENVSPSVHRLRTRARKKKDKSLPQVWSSTEY